MKVSNWEISAQNLREKRKEKRNTKSHLQCMGRTLQAYSWISEFRFLPESNKNGTQMHFKCDFLPLRIQTFTESNYVKTVATLQKDMKDPHQK